MEICHHLQTSKNHHGRYKLIKQLMIRILFLCHRYKPDKYIDWEFELNAIFVTHNFSERNKVKTAISTFTGDVGQPTSITMTSHPTHAKSPWASKVNSFLFEISFPTLWNAMLLEHPPLCIARFDTMDTKPMGGAEEAQELISSKAYAWTSRRKRQGKR